MVANRKQRGLHREIRPERMIGLRQMLFVLAFLALLGGDFRLAHSQSCLESGRQLWKEKNFAEAVAVLEPCLYEAYGKRDEVYYMLGTGCCMLPNRHDDGMAYLRWLYHNYPLDAASKSLVQDALAKCGNPLSDDSQPVRVIWASSAGVRSVGKTWYSANAAPVRSDPVRFVREIPEAEFRKRLVQVHDEARAFEVQDSLLHQHYDKWSSDHFVYVNLECYLPDHGFLVNCLETAFTFFRRAYDADSFANYITVYLTPDVHFVGKLAEDIHGLHVPNNTLGYSFHGDLSVVGAAGAEGMYFGTFIHELFHLVVRSNFGDIPCWLDEGMASLYEVSRIASDGSLMGDRNPWRERVLDSLWSMRPSVGELVAMGCTEFNAEGQKDAEAHRAVNQATARYLLLFLQEEGRLQDVYLAFRDRSVLEFGDSDNPGAYDADRFAAVLRRNLEDVDDAFDDWYTQLPHRGEP